MAQSIAEMLRARAGRLYQDPGTPPTIEESDQQQATREAFTAGRYYKDKNGNMQIRPRAQ